MSLWWYAYIPNIMLYLIHSFIHSLSVSFNIFIEYCHLSSIILSATSSAESRTELLNLYHDCGKSASFRVLTSSLMAISWKSKPVLFHCLSLVLHVIQNKIAKKLEACVKEAKM